MLWLKAFHVIFVVTWFAGLFYLPRLFVYHAATDDAGIAQQFAVMERRLYIITHIGGGLATLLGLAIWVSYPWVYRGAGWLHLKLVLVLLLWGYHLYCGVLLRRFARGDNRYSSTFYRWFNEIPSAVLIAVVILAVVQPF